MLIFFPINGRTFNGLCCIYIGVDSLFCEIFITRKPITLLVVKLLYCTIHFSSFYNKCRFAKRRTSHVYNFRWTSLPLYITFTTLDLVLTSKSLCIRILNLQKLYCNNTIVNKSNYKIGRIFASFTSTLDGFFFMV